MKEKVKGFFSKIPKAVGKKDPENEKNAAKTELLPDEQSQKNLKVDEKETGQKIERKAEEKAGQKIERKAEPKAGQRSGRKAEPKAGQKTERKTEPNTGQKIERKDGQEAEQKIEAKAGQKIEQTADENGSAERKQVFKKILHGISSALKKISSTLKTLSPRMLLTVALLGIMIVAATIGIIAAVILHHADNLPLAVPYSNKALVYQASEDTALAVSSAMSSDLCVGKDNQSREDVVLKEGESAALFNLDDKEVVFAKNMYDKIYPASITKIMTAILTLKYGNMDDVVTIMWRDLELESGSQVVGFRIGDQITVRELLHGLLVHSGNDAAMALARYIGGGSMNNFIEMMNDELIQIGATGSHFTNPTGLQDTDHYTTVYDIYLMLNEAIKYTDFVSIMQISVYNVTYTSADGETKFVNLDSTDHYLTGEIKPPKDVVVLGGKTGTTSAAGHCLAIVSQNAFGQPYISIIVGAQTADDLYEDMNVLLSEIN